MNEHLLSTLRKYFAGQPVKRAWLFGSFSRGEARADSDIDILVNFDDNVSLFKYAAMTEELEDLLKRAVDLVSESSLFSWVRPSVEHDRILIYEREA
ncbi:MAG: nucleotidyltransferase family protein [Muribaculaceae bacterium]|nr:nucleotidyltransferase family protein [Muribaculaceae bacterium]